MQIKWLGTATILLSNESDKILIDPYLAKYSKDAFDFDRFHYEDIKAIFITHPHLDHFSDIAYFVEKTNCPIYVNKRGLNTAIKYGYNVSRFTKIKPYDIVKIGSIEIKAYPGIHIKFDIKQKVNTVKRIFKNKMLGQALQIALEHFKFSMKKKDVLDFYIKTQNDNVFVLGSAETHPTVRYPSNINTLILPYQGRGDMCQHAAKIVKQLNPQKIFLDHFDDAFPPISHSVRLDDFIGLMNQYKIPLVIPTKYKV